MYINAPVSPLRNHDSELDHIYVVVGEGDCAGRIKTEYWATNKEPGLARIDWDTKDGRRIRVKAIRIDPDLEQRGWLLLEEEYKKEGRMSDWEEFKDFQRACRLGQIFMDAETKERTKADPCPGFPTQMLPKSVQALAIKGKGPNYYWKPKSERDGETQLAAQLPTADRSGDDGASPAERSRRRS